MFCSATVSHDSRAMHFVEVPFNSERQASEPDEASVYLKQNITCGRGDTNTLRELCGFIARLHIKGSSLWTTQDSGCIAQTFQLHTHRVVMSIHTCVRLYITTPLLLWLWTHIVLWWVSVLVLGCLSQMDFYFPTVTHVIYM